jgi:UDP-N-acetylglucosamine acyltransferase
VRIGAGSVVREYVTIHRATQPEAWTEIGGECLIMAMSHIAHDCRLGDGVIVINYAGITGHCQIGDRATIGGLTGMVPFTRIGTYAYVGGCAKVVLDVPPYLLVDGAPATVRGVNVVGLRRGGVPAADRRALQDAYRVLYRSGMTPRHAAERLRDDAPASGPVRHLLEFILSGRRGVCGAPGSDDAALAAGEASGADGESLA